jgi:DNA uptake protein ComE-like DNA-binding protein
MITVLWVIVVATVVATAAVLSGRHTVYAARNRIALDRAYWLASGCAARAHAAIDARLMEARSFEEAAVVWRTLDHLVLPVSASNACTISLEAAGTRLDVNGASRDMLERLFLAMGRHIDAADLAAAIADWRDTNGSLVDLRQLDRVRGFGGVRSFDSVLTTEPGRISLATAAPAVLRSVPGLTSEAAERFAALRDAGTPAPELTSILGDISRASAETLMANYPAIERATTANPDAWILEVRASAESHANSVIVTRRLVRAGRRATVVQWRSAQ